MNTDNADAAKEPAVAPNRWPATSAMSLPVMLVTGAVSPFVTDDDVAEFRRRLPGLRHEIVADAGHAVQSDQPLVLAGLVEEFVFAWPGALADLAARRPTQ